MEELTKWIKALGVFILCVIGVLLAVLAFYGLVMLFHSKPLLGLIVFITPLALILIHGIKKDLYDE